MNSRKEVQNISFFKLNKVLSYSIIGFVCFYILVQVVITASVGTKSEEIFNVRSQKAELRLENEILTSKIDATRSLENSKEFAKTLNLETKNIIFLEENDGKNVALGQ